MVDRLVCIYYDMDVIRDADVRSVIDRVGNGEVIHIHKKDAEWLASLACRREVVETERSPHFRNELMKKLDQICEQIRASPGWRRIITYQGIDLLEVARYEWFFSIYQQVHRVWVVEQIIHWYSPDALIWVLAPNQISSFNQDQLGNYSTRNGKIVQISLLSSLIDDGKSSFWRASVSYWRQTFSDIKYTALKGLRTHRNACPNNAMSISECPKILFIENFPNSARITATIAQILQQKASVETLFVATRSSVVKVVEKICRVALLDDLPPLRVWADAVYKMAEVSWLMYTLTGGKSSDDQTPFGEFKLIEPHFSLMTAKSWRRAALFSSLCNYVITHFHPWIVATTSNTGCFARAAVIAAKKFSAETYLVQHGMANLDDFETHILQDKAFVWGERDKREWIRIGYLPENVIVTGSTKFDQINRVNKLGKSSPENPADSILRIAYFPSLAGGSTVSTKTTRVMIEMVINSVKSFQDAELVIKLKREDSFDIAPDSQKDIRVVRDQDASEVILQSSLVIVSTSTVGVEACALDKPLIVLCVDGVQIPPYYEEYGAALLASNEQELCECISMILEKKDVVERLRCGRKKLIDDMLAGLLPGAADRIAGALLLEIDGQTSVRAVV